MWVLDSYFLFDLLASLVCSTLSVFFFFLVSNRDSSSISEWWFESHLFICSDECRLAEVSECEIEEFEIKLKKFNNRCENRFVKFFSLKLQIADSEINWLISRKNEFKRSMRKSILLNYLSSKTIARFEAKFNVTKVCFFVIV
jgi:hypothetical protein